jgi:deazaflavin-dependent oxidoreductase (nitroreductase family)
MAILDPQLERRLQQGFKSLNRVMVSLWRLGLGPWINAWPEVGGRIMVLTHTGRKSGLRRRTPVNYALVQGELNCTAGFGSASDWYRNLRANANVEVWLPNGWWAGVAEEVTDPPTRLRLMRQVLIASGFAARVVGINPHSMTDEALSLATARYPLIHIRRTSACTGPGGPGELAWIWPLATLILLPLVCLRRRRR